MRAAVGQARDHIGAVDQLLHAVQRGVELPRLEDRAQTVLDHDVADYVHRVLAGLFGDLADTQAFVLLQ